MNLLFVNFVHPDFQHVSSMRMRLFAEALARSGHRLVLLTHPLHADDPVPAPEEVASLLAAHDWATPFYLVCRPQPKWYDLAARATELPRPLRRSLIAINYLVRGGLYDDWVRGSRPYWPALIRCFRPDLAWAVFGDTSSLVLAQGFAHAAGIPWLMDYKDNWELFIPPSLRRVLAHRFRDAAAFTANAALHAAIAARYHRQRHAVIYSGVVPEMIAPHDATKDCAIFRITLIGSLHGLNVLQNFLRGIARWLDDLAQEDRQKVEFVYAGASHRQISDMTASIALPCRVRIEPYLPLGELGRLCQRATVNTYLWTPFGFHHKLLELLACGRPVISFPGEHRESIDLARQIGGDLRPCRNDSELAAALGDIWRDWRQENVDRPTRIDATALTWEAMAQKLERFLVERTRS